MVTVPSRVDAVLKDNFAPSQNSIYNATAIAMAEVFIVSPPGIAEEILRSTNDKDLKFFDAFAKEYQTWMNARGKAASEKKSGGAELEGGSESALWSETGATSSQPIPAGLPSPNPTLSSNTDKS